MDSIADRITSTLEKLHILPSTDKHDPTSTAEEYVYPTQEQVRLLREKYAKQSQDHVFSFWSSLSSEQKTLFYAQLCSIDPTRVTAIADDVLSNKAAKSEEGDKLEPIPSTSCASTFDASPENLTAWREAGLSAIAKGEVAVLLMAGGQGTRLGSKDPKGCYDIGLPSGKSLFQLQAERLVKLQKIAAEEHGNRDQEVVIPWYIMTSGPTRKATEDFLKSKGYFGLKVSFL